MTDSSQIPPEHLKKFLNACKINVPVDFDNGPIPSFIV